MARRSSSTRPAMRSNAGIATVYQDLAVVDLMETWRNFFLGSEIRKPMPVFKPLDIARMRATTSEQLAKLGIHLADVNQPLGDAVGRPTSMRRDRPRGVLRRQGADSR